MYVPEGRFSNTIVPSSVTSKYVLTFEPFVWRTSYSEESAPGAHLTQSIEVRLVSTFERVIVPSLTVTTGSAEKVYDGTELTQPAASAEGLVNGETVTVTASGSITLAGVDLQSLHSVHLFMK